VLSPLLGWLISRIHHHDITVEKAALFTFLTLGTHVLIDLLTTYGTQILAPFSQAQFAWNVLFIIDPLFTLPLLFFLILSLFPGEVRAKLFRNAIGIILATAYVVVSILLKFSADTSFERALARQKIPVQRMITVPTPFNNVLWRCVAESADGYWVGYYSLLDESFEIPFFFVPRNEMLLAGIEDQRAVQTLRWFSDGWFSAARSPEGALLFRDLRFGEFDMGVPENSFGLGNPRNLAYSFTFAFMESGVASGPDRLTIRQEYPMPEDLELALSVLWKRIMGR
jgi:inner membrane protein